MKTDYDKLNDFSEDFFKKQIEMSKKTLKELEKYNPELLDKERLLAITKSDLIDDELKALITAELPKNIDHVFISSVAQLGIDEMKDKLWALLQK